MEYAGIAIFIESARCCSGVSSICFGCAISTVGSRVGGVGLSSTVCAVCSIGFSSAVSGRVGGVSLGGAVSTVGGIGSKHNIVGLYGVGVGVCVCYNS